MLVSYLDGENVKRKPFEVCKYDKAPTGRNIAQHLAELPIPAKDVLSLVADTTSVNSGTGKIGGACYWYLHNTNTKCFVVMCRFYILECISGVALTKFNLDVSGCTPKFEKGPSGTVKSLHTLCYNIRILTHHFDLWALIPEEATFSWPAYFAINTEDDACSFQHVQKLFCTLISQTHFTKNDIAKQFCAVGVRWLAFLCSLLHTSLSYTSVRKALAEIPDEKVPNKTYRGYIRNTLEILDELNLRHRETVSDIFRFSVVQSKCWRLTVMSNGTDLLKVTIDTTRELAVIGKKYFTTFNSHLYNADGVFLPLSLDRDCIKLTSEILEDALEQGMNYELVPFKRLKNKYSKQQLTEFSISSSTLAADSGFRFRAANSPLFHYLGISLEDIASLYKRADCSRRQGIAKLIPGHNQSCERLVGDLKHSKDINTLVTLAETREGNPRSAKGKNVLKGVSL